MVVATAVPTFHGMTALRTFSVAEYQRMIDHGILTDDDAVELLNGHVVLKMPRNPPHESAVRKLNRRLAAILPTGWVLGCQAAVDFTTSRPEPDFSLIRGDEAYFDHRHPTPADVGLLIEVADSSLLRDRVDKAGIYAAASIPVYWVVNLVDACVEVFTDPTHNGYATARVFPPGTAVPVELDGTTIGQVFVVDLMP